MKKRKSRFSDEEMHRFPIALPKSLSDEVQEICKKEISSMSIMCWKLIAEAVEARKKP